MAIPLPWGCLDVPRACSAARPRVSGFDPLRALTSDHSVEGKPCYCVTASSMIKFKGIEFAVCTFDSVSMRATMSPCK